MRIRINDFECRKSTYREDEYEMVKWQPNSYYSSEKKLLDEGYEKVAYPNSDDWAMTKNNYTINSSCFKNPESCYVIAQLTLNRREPDINMETVGGRLLDLEPDELDMFMRVYRLAYNMIMETLNED